jgi:hypothetical protein
MIKYYENIYYIGDKNGNLYYVLVNNNKYQNKNVDERNKYNMTNSGTGNSLKNFDKGNGYQYQFKH